MNIKTAVILGGGESSRFYPFQNQNKALTVIAGVSLFARTLESLKKIGVESVIVVEGEDCLFSQALEGKHFSDMHISFVTQKSPSGMGEALLLAEKYISENHFFVLSAYHFEISDFGFELAKGLKNKNDIAIVTKTDSFSLDFGGVAIQDGKVQVHEKSEEAFPSRIVSMYALNQEFINVLKNQKSHQYSFEDAINSYTGETILLEAKRPTVSLKYPWDLLDVKDEILQGIEGFQSETAEIAKTAVIQGNVYIGKHVKIQEGAIITGPCYLGDGAYVGTHTILRSGVVLEKNAVVGAGMEVKNSFIMEGATTHSGFIGDSVIGKHVKIAAGFITGNVKLNREDISSVVKGKKTSSHKKYLGVFIGDYSKIGIHVGTMPGIIIGKKVVVGPGTTVMENIPDDVTYYSVFKEIVEK